MATKEDWNELWERKSDREIAINIRSDGKSIYDQIVELIQRMADNVDIDINQDIKDDFVDLYQELGVLLDRLQAWAADHPDFMDWRPPK